MIPIKTKTQIEIMREGGKRLSWVMKQVLEEVKPGVALYQIDKLAELLIKKQGGKPSFKMVPGYKWATCINVNQGVVHGIPNEYRLKDGDLVSIDTGFFYRGWHTDMAETVLVTNRFSRGAENLLNRETIVFKKRRFLKVGEGILKKAIEVAKVGNRVGHISWAMEKEIKKAGFSPIEVFTGHGVGEKLHEDPQIPCFLSGKIKNTSFLKPGMTLAIEVIYAQGSPEVILKDDGWTVETADSSLAALFEKTILITKQKAKILT